MAVGNTFGATALSSYGGFWIAFAIVFTPGGFDIQSSLVTADNGSTDMFYDSLGLFLMVRSSVISKFLSHATSSDRRSLPLP